MSQRVNRAKRIAQIVRARRYTWLGEGLAGVPIENALTEVLANVLEICDRERFAIQELLANGRKQLDVEHSETHAA